ncbi:MAG: [acyl-carrier-protein] S-malonyltransferase [Gammaproteobacteria bacterium]|nr:[acyl-carrier-protein] S-malonyltransferase [Gammaproteobacteria bacterium]
MAYAAFFPGQGSQTVGMLADLLPVYTEIESTFAEASEALGYDLWALAQQGPTEALSQTEVTQPLMLTAGVALFRAWTAHDGPLPQVMAGHSLGEYTALTCAGTLSLADAVRVVRARGQFMQSAVPAGTGAMAAVIGLDDALIEEVLAQVALDTGRVIEAVNYNAPGQLVIAGHAEAVEAALPGLKAAGAKRALPLPVSAPFHCALMRPAAEQLASVLADVSFQAPVVPVVQNVSLRPETDPDVIRAQLVTQTYSPVRWTDTVRQLIDLGLTRAVEFGPGAVLSGLVKRIDPTLACLPTGQLAAFDEAIKQSKECV